MTNSNTNSNTNNNSKRGNPPSHKVVAVQDDRNWIEVGIAFTNTDKNGDEYKNIVLHPGMSMVHGAKYQLQEIRAAVADARGVTVEQAKAILEREGLVVSKNLKLTKKRASKVTKTDDNVSA